MNTPVPSNRTIRHSIGMSTLDPDLGALPNYRKQAIDYAAALREIVAMLGPESVCDCGQCTDADGLHAEASEALSIARRALGLNPSE